MTKHFLYWSKSECETVCACVCVRVCVCVCVHLVKIHFCCHLMSRLPRSSKVTALCGLMSCFWSQSLHVTFMVFVVKSSGKASRSTPLATYCSQGQGWTSLANTCWLHIFSVALHLQKDSFCWFSTGGSRLVIVRTALHSNLYPL